MMTIGAAWNIDNPEKPWALWDPDANIVIPFGLDAWLVTALGTAYGSHQVLTASPLECVSVGAYVDGTVGVRMRVIPTATFKNGTKYPFTLRVTGSDGITQDDRTFWIKIKPR